MKHIPTSLMPLESAAEHYGVSLSSLINAGAHGRLRVFAPVMNEGIYTWPNDIAAVAFPCLDKPFKQSFGLRDRVLVYPESLLEIEAKGSSVIERFAAPDMARKLASEAVLFSDSCLGGEVVWAAETRPGFGSVATVVSRSGKQIEPSLEHLALTQAWLPSDPLNSQTPTTVRNLFVKPLELEELVSYADAGIRPSHGNTVHNAARREQVLAAAIHLLHKSPERFKTAISLADAVEHLPPEFWLAETRPPLGLKSMTELIARAMESGRVSRQRSQ